jgi:hypothetical protein
MIWSFSVVTNAPLLEETPSKPAATIVTAQLWAPFGAFVFVMLFAFCGFQLHINTFFKTQKAHYFLLLDRIYDPPY